jgi:hypothetical protein
LAGGILSPPGGTSLGQSVQSERAYEGTSGPGEPRIQPVERDQECRCLERGQEEGQADENPHHGGGYTGGGKPPRARVRVITPAKTKAA